MSRCSDNGGSHAAQLEDLDVSDATFDRADLTSFCRLDELGLDVLGQRLEPDRAVLVWRVLKPTGGAGGCWIERTLLISASPAD